jgi:ACR3 family arsenite transporter
VLLAQIWRKLLLPRGMDVLERTCAKLGRISIPALLLTLMLFAFQGKLRHIASVF